MANKVEFGISELHVGTYEDNNGTVTLGTPYAQKGAVSFAPEEESENTKFYADNIAYYVGVSNQGYEGTLEVAKIPDVMFEDVWGYTLGSTSKVLTESAFTEPKTFALLFQIDGDQNNDYYVIYCCTGARPNIGSQTIEASKEPGTQSIDITAAPRTDGKVFAKTTKDTPSGTTSAWFTTVFVESTST